MSCGSCPDFRPVVSLPRLRLRPDQYNFPHLQRDDRCRVSPYTFQITFSGGPDPQTDRVFATPSVILRSAGSVGMALTMWLLGAAVVSTGSAVYLEYGTVSTFSPSRMSTHRNEVTGTTPERRREELPRRCLQTPQVYGDVRLCYKRVTCCEPSFQLSPQFLHRRLGTIICY